MRTLLSVAHSRHRVARIEQLYEAGGRDLKRMIERLLPLKGIKGDAKEHIRAHVLSGAEPAPREGGP